jgi:glycosyltransferase involved in cell wall biosynthesis
MRVLVATDAAPPQVNGVVRTLENLARDAARLGDEIRLLTPQRFATLPMPSYPEIRLALTTPRAIGALIRSEAPDAIHIATEGPVGFGARRWCLRNARRFTTSYHTRFPEYIAKRMPVPLNLTYAMLRRFHNAGNGCMVATPTLEHELSRRGFDNLMHWTRGVDGSLFHPRSDSRLPFPGPIFLYVGRIAVEKNLESFLALDLPGSKVIIGDGPDLARLKAAHPGVHFLGVLIGEALARAYAGADVFVFPSRTDTFGMVLLEALAAGLPVAAYPVPGPLDVIGSAPVGVLANDLGKAALAALDIPRQRCREFALEHSWEASARQFLDNVVVGQGDEMPRLVFA